MKSAGTLCSLFIKLLIVLVGTQCLLVNGKKSKGMTTISTEVSVGSCSGTTAKEVVRPCVAMANQIVIGGIPVTISENAPPVRLIKRIFVDCIRGMFTPDFDFDEDAFKAICSDISKIDTCLGNTVSRCTSGSVSTAEIQREVTRIRNSYPFSYKGKRPTCDPSNGKVHGSIKGKLKKADIAKCLRSIGEISKDEITKVLKTIGRNVIDKNVNLDGNSKASRKAMATCRKLDDVIKLVRQAGRCDKKKCKGKSLHSFAYFLKAFLGIPGKDKCGKEVDENDSLDKKKVKRSKKDLIFLGCYGCTHIENKEIDPSNFITCSLNGNITMFQSDKVELRMNLTYINVTAEKVCAVANKVQIGLYGDKQYCGKKGDKPSRTLDIGAPGDGNDPQDDDLTCDGKKKIKIKVKKDSKKYRVVTVEDPCSGVNMRVRVEGYQRASKILPVSYVTIRMLKTALPEVAGELTTGCSNTVDITTAKRRRKRSTSTAINAAAAYDGAASGVPAMTSGMAAVSEDQGDLEKLDDDLVGGAASSVYVNVALLLVGCLTTMLRL